MFVWIRNFVLIAAILMPWMSLLAQGTSKAEALKKIKTEKEAELLLKSVNPRSGAIGRYNAIVDSVEFREISKNYKIGDIFFGKKATYKILKKEEEVIYRCQYIYLDGNIYNPAQIDSIRTEIITKFNSGTSFKALSDKYSMDGNKKGGELGWFHGEKMGEEFIQTLIKYQKGQIFTCDATSKKAHYVVLKTHAPMTAESWVYITLR